MAGMLSKSIRSVDLLFKDNNVMVLVSLTIWIRYDDMLSNLTIRS